MKTLAPELSSIIAISSAVLKVTSTLTAEIHMLRLVGCFLKYGIWIITDHDEIRFQFFPSIPVVHLEPPPSQLE
jgi:hypothetical protein